MREYKDLAVAKAHAAKVAKQEALPSDYDSPEPDPPPLKSTRQAGTEAAEAEAKTMAVHSQKHEDSVRVRSVSAGHRRFPGLSCAHRALTLLLDGAMATLRLPHYLGGYPHFLK